MSTFQNPSLTQIGELLKQVRNIAVVGLSPKPNRPSHHVAAAMQRFGYRIIPVRPGVSEVLGERAYPDLFQVPERIDLVNVFRAPEHVDDIVDACLQLALPAIWLQDGVVNEAAAQRARDGGMVVVMDRCVYRDYLQVVVP